MVIGPMMRTMELTPPKQGSECAEFLPLDSACEEHTCPWNFAEGGRDLGLSNVQLGNENSLSIPSSRKVMMPNDVLGPGGRVILHAQNSLCAERRQKATSQCWKAHAEWRRSQVRRQELMDRSANRHLSTTRACASEREDLWPLDPKDCE